MKKKFYLFKRGKTGVYYASVVDPVTGEIYSAKSTGTADRDEALITASQWAKNGVPSKRGNARSLPELREFKSILNSIKTADMTASQVKNICDELQKRGMLFSYELEGKREEKQYLLDFLQAFWNPEKSAYIQDKQQHGKRFSLRYLKVQQAALSAWKEFFSPSKLLNEVTRQDLRDFGKFLFGKGAASGTIQNKLGAGTLALAWAEREGIIPINPGKGLTRYTGGKIKRDCLTDSEMAKLFQVQWEDKRSYVAALIASTAALRSAEVRALRKLDISETCIEVNFSYSNCEGLKPPKNGEQRLAPLYPEVKRAIDELLLENPHSDLDNPFIFYSADESKPLGGEVFLKYLRRAMKAAGIDVGTRRIDFHSLRHFTAYKMVAEKGIGAAQIVLGHKTQAMTEHYADHQNAELIREIVQRESIILPFIKKSA